MDWNWLFVISVVVLNNLVLFVWKPWAQAYTGEKAKNLARKEDLVAILTEVRSVTATQKLIEARVSDDLWIKQTRWNQKRNRYFDLMRLVSKQAEAYFSAIAVLESGGEMTLDLHSRHYKLQCAFRIADLFANESCFDAWKEYADSRNIPVSPDAEWARREWVALLHLEKRLAVVAKDDLQHG